MPTRLTFSILRPRFAALFAFLLFTALSGTQAQTSRLWVFLKDKSTRGAPQVSEATLLRRAKMGLTVVQESDFGPNLDCIQAIGGTGAKTRYASRWLNAVCVTATPAQQEAIGQLPYVKSILPTSQLVATRSAAPADSMDMAFALRQIGYPSLKSQGLTGKGVTVGLIDAGFADADHAVALRTVYQNRQVLATRDFVAPERPNFYRKSPETLDDHGAEVLSLVAGYDRDYDKQIGAATGAQFVLARTDDAIHEGRIEEDHWLAALEWMDSLGVQLINTSLGYALGFDDTAQNHRPPEIDGKTTVVTKAVNIATQQKGIVVVVSAGNDGDDARWHIISAPADAPDALAIGATFGVSWTKMGYSGLGPDKAAQVKPDVSCYSLLGTSFSAPVITGFIACLMEKAPNQPVKKWLDVVRGSGHLSQFPNNYLGYGVPNGASALRMLEGQPAHPAGFFTQVEAKGSQYHMPVGKVPNSNVVVFHKKDAHTVIRQQLLTGFVDSPTVIRPDGAKRSTVAWPNGAMEIIWK